MLAGTKIDTTAWVVADTGCMDLDTAAGVVAGMGCTALDTAALVVSDTDLDTAAWVVVCTGCMDPDTGDMGLIMVDLMGRFTAADTDTLDTDRTDLTDMANITGTKVSVFGFLHYAINIKTIFIYFAHNQLGRLSLLWRIRVHF